MRVLVRPFYNGVDQGDGGIRRVVEAQERYLPEFDIEVVRDIARADLVAVHAGEFITTDLPVVEHCHGLYWAEYDWEAAWFYQLNRVVIDSMLRADYVTAPSEWVANIIRRGAWIQPKVLYHGVELNDWPLQKKHADYILWNKTRIDPICDPEPVNTLSLRNNDLQFATTYGEQRPNVTVLGLQPYELAKQVVQNAALYLCTTRETFGIGTLEAMASGVPIVGWAWGGQRELITNGVHGYLAQPGNYEELEYGIRLCLEQRTAMGKAARQLVQDKFTWHKAMKRYAQLYTKVLAPREAHPKVSVIITNYKLERYIEEAVASVLGQENFPQDQVEIIVVNDASPTWDFTYEDLLVGNGVKVINNEKNQYLAGALNTGIANATGDYIVCLDADNLLGPRALATLATALDNDKTLDIVYGAMALYDTGHVSGWPGEFNYRAQITHHNQIPSTCMYRKRVWERSGGYRERCRTAEDADFWCRVTSLGFKPKKVTDAVTLIYRDRDDSMSRTERDWGWHDWYTWGRAPKLTPFVAPQQADRDIKVPTYEPVKVSVVIPCGPGHEHYVIDAVDSLVAQTFQNWECIVVNDTGAALPWIHPFVKVINLAIDDPNDKTINRVSRARNAGIQFSKGKYFVLLDADDYLQPSALAHMYDTITKAESGTGYAYTDWYVAETKEKHVTPNYSCATVLDRFNHAVTCIYLREAWQAVHGFDQQLKGWEDWDFVIALNVAGYCGIRIPYPLLQYRLNGGKRREELYAQLQELKQEMYEKWKPYIDGEKKMACGCQNSNGVAASRQQGDGAFAGDGMTQLEYVGDILGPLNYVGKVTGNRYLFGLEPEHSVRYVFNEDIPAFLTVEGFRYYDEGNNEPVLEALGPPQREQLGELVNA